METKVFLSTISETILTLSNYCTPSFNLTVIKPLVKFKINLITSFQISPKRYEMKLIILFILWFVGLSVPLSYMMGIHSLSLIPSKNANIKNLILNQSAQKKWSQLHFLGADCECSKNIFNSLMNRSPLLDINEQIFVIGKNDLWIKQLKAKGYSVENGEMENFSKHFSINAVPQLSILDEKQNLLYSGGYTSKRGPASTVEDQSILAELIKHHTTQERPIFGCLNGSVNRRIADPMSLKY